MNALKHEAAPTRRTVIPVPQEFLKQDVAQSALMIGTHLVTFALPVALSTYLLTLNLPAYVVLPLVVVLSLVGSFGLHSLGLMGHEGTHFTLHPKRIVSSYIGVITSALVPFHLDMGFAIRHNQHHRFTNTDKDPDLKVFGKYNTIWSRLFLARLQASHEYLVTTLQLATGKYPADWDAMLNLTRSQITTLARVNIASSLGFLAVYVFVAIQIPMFTVALAATFTLAILVSGLRPYLEHAGTDAHRFTSSRSWISPLFNVAYAGINFHLAHHLAPGVPAYRIAAFHDWLVQNHYIAEEHIVHAESIVEIAHVVRSLPYGSRP